MAHSSRRIIWFMLIASFVWIIWMLASTGMFSGGQL